MKRAWKTSEERQRELEENRKAAQEMVGDFAPANRIRELQAEVERLNKWADGFSDAQLKERAACEAHNQELRDRAEALQAKLAAIEGLPRFGVHLTGFWMRQTKGPWIKYTDIDAILRGETEDGS